MQKIDVLFWRKRLCLQNRTNQNVVDFYENVDNAFRKKVYMQMGEKGSNELFSTLNCDIIIALEGCL